MTNATVPDRVSLRWVFRISDTGGGSRAYASDTIPHGFEPIRQALGAFGVFVHALSPFGMETRMSPAQIGRVFAADPAQLLTGGAPFPVPESLRSQVDFIYRSIPAMAHGNPVQPPETDLYHLNLDKVCEALKVHRCHARGLRGEGIRIAMTDTGFDDHPYFRAQGYSIERVSTIETMDPARDESGHGTAASANALAVAPRATLIGVRQGDFSVTALETALAQRPHVISNSWGWDRDYKSMDRLQEEEPDFYFALQDMARTVKRAVSEGVVLVFSGGNGQHTFPASMPEVIAVGGVFVEESGALKASSLAGSFESMFYPGRMVPDVCGVVGEGGPYPRRGHIMLPTPRSSILEGENLPLEKTTSGWAITSGTSSAAPQIAGVVALMLDANPTLKPAEIKALLQKTAQGPVSTKTGRGLVDGDGACRASVALDERGKFATLPG